MLLIIIPLAVMAQTLLNGDLGVVQGQTYLVDEPEYLDDIDETEYAGDIDETEHPDDKDETESPGDIDEETEYIGDIDNTICEISSDRRQIRPSQCCRVGDILPSNFKENFYTCEKTHSVTYQIPDGYTEDPWTLWVHHTACLDECIFDKLGLLTNYLKIDKVEMRASFTYGIKGHVLKALNMALDNCFAIYKKEMEDEDANRDLDCKSSATDLLGCYMREVFLNCPNNLWMNDNELRNQCDKLWDKVDSCPKIHVMLHEPTLQQIKTKKTKPKRV